MICKKCKILNSLMKYKLSNRSYWLITELFVELHHGYDYCIISKKRMKRKADTTDWDNTHPTDDTMCILEEDEKETEKKERWINYER